MFGFKSRVVWLLLALTLVVLAQQDELPYEQQDSPRIYIRYEENWGASKIIWQFSQAINPEVLPIPAIQQEPQAGRLVITMQNIAAASFFGPYKHRIGERYPLDYAISFPDSHQIMMQVQARPFQHVSCAYQYDLNCYIISLSYLASASGGEDTFPYSSKLSWWQYLNYLKWAVPLAAVLVMAIILLVILLRRKKNRQPPQRQEKPKTMAPLKSPLPSPTPPEPPSEELIKKVAQEKKISYDEAALLLNLSQEDRDVVA